jgi:hypothetical protein
LDNWFEMPVRKIPKNYRNVTGVAASSKAVGAAQFESTLERDFLTLLEFSAEVDHFEVQPLKIEWRDERGISRSYTPDVLVEFKLGIGRTPWLCEVKYRADIQKHWDELHPKFRQGVHLARQKGWRFRLITEVEVRTTCLANIRFLMPFKFRDIPEAAAEQLLGQLRTVCSLTPAALLQSLSSDRQRQAEWLPVLWHLIAHHRIGVDLELALRTDSLIWSVS